jgi:hypothetical protein
MVEISINYLTAIFMLSWTLTYYLFVAEGGYEPCDFGCYNYTLKKHCILYKTFC